MPGPKPKFPELQNREWLFQQYRVKKKSMYAIAVELGCGETCVYKWIVKNNIPRYTRSEQLSGKPKSAEHYAKMKARYEKWKRLGTLKKENHPNWKGGMTEKMGKERSRLQKFKLAVYKKSGLECEVCGSKERINAHHIKDFNEYPSLRFNPKNGLCLCETCHFFYHRISRLIRRKSKKLENSEPAREIAKGSLGECDGQG